MGRRIAAVIMLCAIPAALCAQESRTKTVRGTVMGLKCYMEGQTAETAAACTRSALTAGDPVGILEESTGQFYIAVSPDNNTNEAAKLLPNAAKKVEVKGAVSEREGLQTVAVQEIAPVSEPVSPGSGDQTQNQTGAMNGSTEE